MFRHNFAYSNTRPFLRDQHRWIALIGFLIVGIPLIVISLVILGSMPVYSPQRMESSFAIENIALTDMWLITYDTDIRLNNNQKLALIDTKAFGESLDSVMSMDADSTKVATIDFTPNINGTTKQRRRRRALINEMGAPSTFRVITRLRISYPRRCGDRQQYKLLYRLSILIQFRVNRRTFPINLRFTNGLNIQANFRLLQLDEFAQSSLAKANSVEIKSLTNTTRQYIIATGNVKASMCSNTQAYVKGFCVSSGMLGVAVKWSRKNGRGNIIVRTPNGKIIYYGNPGPNMTTDQGQREQVGDGTTVDNIYWAANTNPPSGTYSVCFSTGTLFTSGDTSQVIATVELRRLGLAITTLMHTFTTATSSSEIQCMNTSDIFVGSFTYPTDHLSKNSTTSTTLFPRSQIKNVQSTVVVPIKHYVSHPKATNVLLANATPIIHLASNRHKRGIDQDEVSLPTCTSNQACAAAVSAGSGALSVILNWSRVGDKASIIIQIPKNEMIDNENSTPDVTTSQNQHDQVSNSTDINNTYWTSNKMPSSGDYSTCFKTRTLYITGYTSVMTVCWKKESAI